MKHKITISAIVIGAIAIIGCTAHIIVRHRQS